MHKIKSMSDKYNLDITITLDAMLDEYDYNLILLDKYSKLLSVGKNNGSGGKSITIPNWCMKEDGYTLKVQATEGAKLISEESYHLLFRENTLHMEFMQLQNKMNFNCVVRKKLWEKESEVQGRAISVFQRNKYEERYLEQMDAVYCEAQEFYA